MPKEKFYETWNLTTIVALTRRQNSVLNLQWIPTSDLHVTLSLGEFEKYYHQRATMKDNPGYVSLVNAIKHT